MGDLEAAPPKLGSHVPQQFLEGGTPRRREAKMSWFKKSLGEDAKLRQMLNSKISNQKSEIKSCRRSILSRK
jgi:hypothetical protein